MKKSPKFAKPTIRNDTWLFKRSVKMCVCVSHHDLLESGLEFSFSFGCQPTQKGKSLARLETILESYLYSLLVLLELQTHTTQYQKKSINEYKCPSSFLQVDTVKRDSMTHHALIT